MQGSRLSVSVSPGSEHETAQDLVLPFATELPATLIGRNYGYAETGHGKTG